MESDQRSLICYGGIQWREDISQSRCSNKVARQTSFQMNDSDIFLAAVQIEDPTVRAAFLKSVCNENLDQLSRIVARIEQYGKWIGAWDGFSDRMAEDFVKLAVEHRDERESLSAATSNALQIGYRLGAYQIVRCLGVGGMGEVYLAQDDRLDRKVAIKILPMRYVNTPQWVQRFEQEAKSASALNHPNILTIFEIGRQGENHFIVSEFVDGKSLRNVSHSEVSLDKKLALVIQVAEALHAAHSANIVHRDIKPENVMVRPDGLVKVLDFGIAKYCSPSQSTSEPARSRSDTDPGTIMGTIRYMSPEQARRLPIDFRADLFSLGVLMHELFTDALPYASNKDASILVSLMSDEPLPLNRLSSLDNRPLELCIKKLLRKNREERYQSAKEVLVDLKDARRECDRFADLGSNREAITSELGVSRHSDTDRSISTETTIDIPEVRYTRSGDVNIAYQIVGSGEIDLVFVMGWVSHLDWFWKEPSFARFLLRLASFARLILFDKRGTGLSDRVPYDQLPSLEQRMDDVRAVMDAAGSEKAILLGVSEGGPMCSLFAATYPQKTLALVMIGSYARRLRATDYPWGPTEEQHRVFLDEIAKNWGGPVGIEARAPSKANDREFSNWWATYLRMGASPGAALALTKMNALFDVRPILKAIQVPTLVLHRTGDRCLQVDEGRYLAEQIPGAKFVELPGNDHLPFIGNQDEMSDAIAEFLTGLEPHQMAHRVLATVLHAEVSPSQNTTSDPQRLNLSQSHFAREMELFRGQTILTTQQSISASFDGPARAIRAAIAIRNSAARLGVELLIGLHTGECDIYQGRVSGPAVAMAKKVADFGLRNEVVASSTVKDLVAGSGIHFTDYRVVRLDDDLAECALFQVKA